MLCFRMLIVLVDIIAIVFIMLVSHLNLSTAPKNSRYLPSVKPQ
jgi:hypothetical protein